MAPAGRNQGKLLMNYGNNMAITMLVVFIIPVRY